MCGALPVRMRMQMQRRMWMRMPLEETTVRGPALAGARAVRCAAGTRDAVPFFAESYSLNDAGQQDS